MADVLDRPIDQIAEPQLANVRGAALLAGIALGAIGWEQIPDLVAVAHRYQPDPANRDLYDRAYQALRAHHKGNRRLYRDLHPVTVHEH